MNGEIGSAGQGRLSRARARRHVPLLRALALLLAGALAAAPGHVFAQAGNSLFSTSPSLGAFPPAPAPGRGGDGFGSSGMLAPPTPGVLMPPAPPPMVPAGQVALALSAKFGSEAAPITGGLTWRVYGAKPEPDGNFPLIREDKSPAPTLVLPAGPYIVHVGFGLANAVKPVTLRGSTVREEFDLPAGGLRMEGKVGDARIPAAQISFDVFKGSQFEPSDRRPIAEHIASGGVVVVQEGDK